jgi:hypothetical protein
MIPGKRGSRVIVQEVQYFGLTKWLREFGADQGLRVVTVPTVISTACARRSSSRPRSNLSDGASLAMRAYLLKLRLVGQSGGYARLNSPGSWDGTHPCQEPKKEDNKYQLPE